MDRELNKSSRLQDGSHEIESNQAELYKVEFPDFVLDADIPEGFSDCSWHNDVSPHWEKPLSEGRVLDIWITYASVEKREYPDASRYLVGIRQAEECEYDVEVFTNDWNAVLQFVKTHGTDKA